MYVDKTMYFARPDGAAGAEAGAYDLLERLDIPFSRIEHDEAATVEACSAVEDVLGIEICKNLFLTNAAKSAFYMLVMPGHKRFVTKEVSRQIGSSRLSFAGPEQMMEMLRVTPGSVSILALANDAAGRVKLIIDRDIAGAEYFGCHPCKNTASLKIKTADILEKLLPALGREPQFVSL